MATGDIPSTLRSSLGRAAHSPHFQAIDAHYFNITDIQAWPIAGLLVLLDGKGQPVRADLHLYDELPSHVQEAAVRQSRLVLQEGYVGVDPVPLRILETQQLREAMDVRLAPPGERLHDARPVRWQPFAAGGLALVALAALIWLVLFLVRPGGGEVTGASEATPQPPNVAASTTSPDAQGAALLNVSQQEGAVGQAVVVEGEGSAASDPASSPAGELAPSRNARADLGIGMRVAIVPGLQLALRSEPGADAGEVVGAMSDGEAATIIGGPRTTQGDSDTIVWWFVQLDDGTQAWAAANTSQQTLLVPAP